LLTGQHKHNARGRPKQRKGQMVFQFRPDLFCFVQHSHKVCIPIKSVYFCNRVAFSGEYIAFATLLQVESEEIFLYGKICENPRNLLVPL
jgi:hypothetical protein